MAAATSHVLSLLHIPSTYVQSATTWYTSRHSEHKILVIRGGGGCKMYDSTIKRKEAVSKTRIPAC